MRESGLPWNCLELHSWNPSQTAEEVSCAALVQIGLVSNHSFMLVLGLNPYMLVPPGWLVLPAMGNSGSVPDYLKYLDQFLMVLLEMFRTGLVFCEIIKTRGHNPVSSRTRHTPKYLD